MNTPELTTPDATAYPELVKGCPRETMNLSRLLAGPHKYIEHTMHQYIY